MPSIWNKLNKSKIQSLSRKLVSYNKNSSVNAIEKKHYNHVRDILLTVLSTESSNKSISVLDYGSNILTISNLKNKLNCNKIKFDIIQQGFAWIADNKIEKKMVKVMKKGSRIMITGYNQKGSQTIDHYSLLGFTKAYNAAKKACS